MDRIIIILIVLLVATWTAAMISMLPRSKTYNCELAEISPDYPVEVRAKCRLLDRG